ncbi:hypothetical protein ACFL6Y_05640 [Elusimicrobiota bacterium]
MEQKIEVHTDGSKEKDAIGATEKIGREIVVIRDIVPDLVHIKCGGQLIHEKRDPLPESVLKPEWLECKICDETLLYNVDLDEVRRNPEFFGLRAKTVVGVQA